MIKIFLAEFRRAMNIWFILGIVGVSFSICFDSWNDLIRSIENSNGYVHYFFWNSAFGGMCRTYLLPIFATFPFAASFSNEKKSKSLAYIVSREGTKRYCIIKYVVNAISGGMVVAIGTAFVLLMLSIKFPMVNSDFQDVQITDMFHSWLAVNYPMKYSIVEICLGFFRGVIWSSVGLLVSIYIEDAFVVTVSPYMINYAFIQFCRLLQIDNRYRLDMILMGRTIVRSSFDTLIIALISTLIIALIIGIVFVKNILRGLSGGNII